MSIIISLHSFCHALMTDNRVVHIMSNISITSSFLEASSVFPARVLNIVSPSRDRHTRFATLFTEHFQCTEHPRNSFSVISFP